MNTTIVPAIDARQQLGKLLEMAYYQNRQFQITRKDKPMARLVGERFMQAIEELVETDQSLADTLALMLNEEGLEIIQHSRQEYREGKGVPIEDVLKEYD